jgi:pyruvate/2-oxoglutarate dehydrogenase complex dihydrolipoamide acyltransferase (E2) component
MAKRTIKFKSFVWEKKSHDYNGDEVVAKVMSKAGEEVDLPAEVIRYGESLGAFVTPEDEAAEAAEVVDVSEMDEDELTDWVSESTIVQIVNVAKNDPSLVQNLLAAENTATGHDPRTGLVEGLARIAGDGEPTSTPTGDEGGGDEAPAETEDGEPTVEEVAGQLGVDLSKVDGTGDDDAVTVNDVKEYYDEELADATDGAIELAEDEDVFLADVTGSGKDGRITKDDVQAHVEAAKAAAAE